VNDQPLPGQPQQPQQPLQPAQPQQFSAAPVAPQMPAPQPGQPGMPAMPTPMPPTVPTIPQPAAAPLPGKPSYFNYNSTRAQKARAAHHFAHKEIRALLVIGGWALLIVGAAVVFGLGTPMGWIIAGLAGPFLMAAAWSSALQDLPPDPRSQTIDAVLESEILGVLPEVQTPQALVGVVSHLRGGAFYASRFGIDANLLTMMLTSAPVDVARIWQEAEQLRQQHQSSTINAAMLTAALIRSAPNIDQILAPLHLGQDDITSGVGWYGHLDQLVAETRKRKHDGGIGRDWAFGYTPMLERFGFNISEHVGREGLLQRDLPSREALATQVVHLLAQGGRHNVALVGALGAGKTTVVHALAKKLLEADPSLPRELHYSQIISLDPSALISQAKGRGELEGLVQHLFYEAVQAKNIILFLDDAQLFFEDGNGSVNMSNVLLPVLEGGALRLILAMDEQRWLRIVQANPALAQSMNRIMVQPTDQNETLLIMENQLPLYEYQQKVTFTFQALETAYRLSNRYLSEQVMPGRALKLLEGAANYGVSGFVTERSVEQAIEQTQGVKVGTADTASERQTLLNLEQLIHERMINQTRAVTVVSDALRRARAGVRNQNRPIGTFLFLGPTGVGKTELAKSVAAVFFGGEDHLVRIDLNEYSGVGDVQRLIAEASQDQHSLTAQIARNPFSVVLLDEIEKAHPNVLNVLLQLLDEGILRDVTNREVSFRDAVIIATSNAGADKIRAHIDAGQQLEQFEEQFTNELINAGIFRPEFLNRFDEIVLFRPLKPEELLQVIDLILKGVNKNMAAQKVTVVVDQDAKQMLVQAGYDPRLGARPMRRVVQRAVENIVANRMLAGTATPGSEIHVTLQDVQGMLQRGNQ
jgi:ATP-dependent Clp protease ATP-binding subunit ClpC